MKKLILTVLIALLAFSLVSLVACGNNEDQSSTSTPTPSVEDSTDSGKAEKPTDSSKTPQSSTQKPDDSSTQEPDDSSAQKPDDSSAAEPTLKEIEGVTFADGNYTYSGEKYSLLASNIPEGVTASYSNNEKTDAGEYTATVTLSGEGFKTKTLQAKLTINKASLNGKISFADNQTADYDGQPHAPTYTGTLPAGVSVSWKFGNKSVNNVTDAGNYSVQLTFSGKNYETLTLTANYVINKASLNGLITFADNQTADYDGQPHAPTYTGTLPAGVSVSWKFNNESVNNVTEAGSYKVQLTFSGNNYETLTLTAYYKIIRDFKDFAKAFIEKFGNVPDPWSFLPSTFAPQYKTVASVPNFTTTDEEVTAETTFVNVSAIPKNVIGKQLDVVYGVLNKTTFALKYINEAHKVFNSIVEAYQTYLDSNPTEYKVFSGTAGVFSYAIELTDDEYYIRGSISGVSVELFANVTDKSYGARIQLSQTTVVKYTVSGDKFTMAMNIQNVAATAVEFEKKNGATVGYVYEYLNAAGYYETSSAAYLNVGEVYTTVIGTKGDFIVGSNGRNCEVYRNSDGEWVGSEVSEQLTENKSYDTLWFHLSKVDGIDSIIRQEKRNYLNANTVYINGATDSIHTKTVALLDTSRRFDIEFKKVYAYTLNEEGEYEQVSFEIPMLFVQESQLSTFDEDFYAKNKAYIDGDVTLSHTDADDKAINYGYYNLLPVYQSIADNLSIKDLCKYLGITYTEKTE